MNAWINAIAIRVVDHAAGRAPLAVADRLREEWQAALPDQDGPLGRLKHALGCWWAAMQINDDDCASGAMATEAPVCAAIAVAGGPRHRPLFAQTAAVAAGDPMMCEINTTPLVDILLVLLVTLVVSLPLLTHAVKLELPQATPQRDGVQREVIDLDIDFDGTVEWNGSAVPSLQQLEGFFRAESQKSPQPEIHFRPDHRVKYELVAKVLAAAQRNGVSNLGFANIRDLGE